MSNSYVVFLRTPYNYDTDAASDESALSCLDPSLAKQSFADECDINTIVNRFGLGYEMPENVAAPVYGDFTEQINDYHTAMNFIAAAHESFDALHADVRSRFNNDPGQFVDFVNDPVNGPELVRMGLAVKNPDWVDPSAASAATSAPPAASSAAPAAGTVST